ncbi:hypothetical protein EYF80_064478 [Liparis tanakae]|uniref:Uncharacterized protein n=1 Tax=Liparis tanakae TaxID=230148 RepID=A0A4Z2EA37_9TELE|nr:hypothetical protein EYF80_064478 [Liparis tanakae]
MSRLHGLKLFINQRLAAAVEDICGHFERTITEYEAEMDRKLLGVVSAAGLQLRAEAGVFLLVGLLWN